MTAPVDVDDGSTSRRDDGAIRGRRTGAPGERTRVRE